MPVSALTPIYLPAYFSTRLGLPSSGAALALQQGVLTTIRASSLPENSARELLHPAPSASKPAAPFYLRFNGQPHYPAWSSALLASFSPHLDEVPLQIEQTCVLPDIGAPLAAARALSLSLSLNAWCQSPLSHARCAQLAQDALLNANQPLGFGIHLQGGLLHLSPSRPRVQARQLLPHELRTPIRLSYFGPSSRPAPTRGRSPRIQRAAKSAQRLFTARPSLLSLAAASRSFALSTNPARFWAADLLAPRPAAGLLVGSKTIFEPGLSSHHPIVHPLRGPPPQTLVVYPSNLGARILSPAFSPGPS